MLAALTRGTFSVLAGSVLLRKAASRYGLRRPTSFARRFVAGERMEDALAVAADIERRGLSVTLDLLGERVTSMDAALEATHTYIDLVQAAVDAGISRNLSVKLTQIGLAVDRATAIDNLRRILEAAAPHDFFVRVDMEGSAYTDDTLETVETLSSIGYHSVGVAVQAALRRSADDVHRLNAAGVSIRLVKGAYREPKSLAFVRPEDVDANFLMLMQLLLTEGHKPAIATHDPNLIDRTRQFARERDIAPDRFEFELLYGIREDLQAQLSRDGYAVRVYVPYGREWFPYFMRRMGERPENVRFVLRHILSPRRPA
jgi:proline dehydrogenase